jgi:hypothetical protein
MLNESKPLCFQSPQSFEGFVNYPNHKREIEKPAGMVPESSKDWEDCENTMVLIDLPLKRPGRL